jgi:hypothetical protein
MGWPCDKSLSECELEAEEQALVPVLSVLRQVQAARDAGSRIVFISDMYLPSSFIKSQLLKHGVAQPEDCLYVSGDAGLTKASGNLFKHMLSTEGVIGSEVVHTGDHWHSDYDVPRRLGIAAKLVAPAALTPPEEAILRMNLDRNAVHRVAGSMRAFRVRRDALGEDGVANLVSQFLGPFILGFASWVLQRARTMGIKRLYFLSRDCQLVWKVARQLAPGFGAPDCRYLYVSRQALLLPSAEGVSALEMPWMRRFFEEPLLNNLLAKLDLKFEEVGSSFSALAGRAGGSFRLRTEKEWEQFWDCLTKKPVKDLIESRIRAHRHTVQQYFRSAGLFEEVPWAVVDLGWFLTCQEAIGKLIQLAGGNFKPQGYYLGLRNSRIGQSCAGPSEALMYEPPADDVGFPALQNIFSRATLLEHIVGCADHPSVHHYEAVGGGATPSFLPSPGGNHLDMCSKLQAGALQFAVEHADLCGTFEDPSVCQQLLVVLAREFFNNPSRSSLVPLSGFSASVDQNGIGSAALIRELNPLTALLPLLPERFAKRRELRWVEGATVISPGYVRPLCHAAQQMALWLKRARRMVG